MFVNSNSSTIAKLNTGQSRQRRRWYAAVLVVAFIMMLMPLDAMALEPGDVVLNKTATPVEGMVNTWDVKLEIEAKDTVTTSDIVLVIDRSGSMSGSKLTNAKNAALEFVDVLLPSTSTRIAVVSFAGEVTINQALTNNATDLNSAINGLYANGGTFTQAAMKQAAAILAGSTATYKNIVLLSDGEPTYSYGINNPYKTNTANLQRNYTDLSGAWETTINTPQAQFNTTRVGSGSSMWERYFNDWGTSDDKYYNNGHAAVAEAGFFKDETNLKYLYTIALDAGTNGTPILDQMASPGKSYTATESELEAIFAAIAGEINAAIKDASITDPMGMGFELIGTATNITTNSGTATLTPSGGINWQAGTIPLKTGSSDERYAYLSYRVEINDDILDVPVPADGLYETNGPTVVTYTNSAGSTVSKNFPIPKVDPILLIVEKVLKNDKGDVITTDDRIFDIHVTSNLGYNQTYSLKAGEKKVMTNLRLEDIYTVSETGVSGTPASALADYDTTVNVYDIDQTTFNIDQGSPDSPVLVTNQEKSLGKLTVKKVFNNMPAAGAPTSSMMSLAAEPLVFSFTVTGPEGFEETFDLGSGGERTFEGLKYGTYTVVETTTGYDTTYDPAGGEVTLSIGQKEGTVTVTNRVQSGIDITATKIWDGGPLPYPEVWFRLFRTVDGETFESAGVEDKKIPIESPFTVTWQNLPQYSPEGISYVYSVQESVLGGTNFVPGTPAGYYKTEDGLTVTNKWVTGSFTPAVTKALSGRDLAAEEFEFVLKEGEKVLQTVKNLADGTIPFVGINYSLDDVGEHTYTITESPSDLGGVTDDTLEITYVVTVSDKGDGTLNVAYDIPEDVEFNNIYEAEGSFAPGIKKVLEGRLLQEGEFEFELYKGEDLIETKSNDVDGNVYFSALTYALEDVENSPHVYTIKEVKGTLGGVEYSEEVITLTIDVTDKGDGTLDVAATYSEVDPTITNIYTATGSFTPAVTKALSGRDLVDGEFTFDLMEGDELIESVSNVDTSIPFAAIDYTLADVGEHTYTITEKVSGLGGVTDDTLTVTYVVTVSDNGDGTLSVTYETPDDTTFNNTYAATGSFTPAVTKALSGRDLVDGEFTFDLMEGDELIESVSNVDTSIPFAAIDYTLADVGEHTYTITEKVSGLGGVTDDTLTVTYVVTVSDNGDGTLSVTYETPDDTTFNNTYAATGRLDLSGTKTLNGRALTEGEFEFELYLEETPLQTVSNAADGSFSFATINYTLADVGTKIYTVNEKAGPMSDIAYATNSYTVEVTITDNGDGTLDVTVSETSDDPSGLDFTNTLTGETSVTISKIWVDDDDAEGLRPDAITIRLWRAIGDEAPLEIDDVSFGPDENGDWEYTFSELDMYDGLGQLYTYSITEDALVNYVSDIEGFTVTNTLTGATDITVSKTWIDENNVDELRPDTITVRLWRTIGDADPEEVDDITFGADEAWQHSFIGLDMYNELGQLYTYSVTEDAVPEYGTAISTTATGFSIINLYVPEEDIPLVVPTPTPTPEPEPTPTPTPIVIEDEEIPQTGQGGAWQGWIGLMLLAGAAAIVLFRRRRRDNESSAK